MTDQVKEAFKDFMQRGGQKAMADAMTKGMPSAYYDLMEIAFTRGAIAGMTIGAQHAAESQALIDAAIFGPTRAAR